MNCEFGLGNIKKKCGVNWSTFRLTLYYPFRILFSSSSFASLLWTPWRKGYLSRLNWIPFGFLFPHLRVWHYTNLYINCLQFQPLLVFIDKFNFIWFVLFIHIQHFMYINSICSYTFSIPNLYLLKERLFCLMMARPLKNPTKLYTHMLTGTHTETHITVTYDIFYGGNSHKLSKCIRIRCNMMGEQSEYLHTHTHTHKYTWKHTETLTFIWYIRVYRKTHRQYFKLNPLYIFTGLSTFFFEFVCTVKLC